MSKALLSTAQISAGIPVLRGQKALFGPDRAALYCVETRALEPAVRRNANRFPKDFMSALSRGEIVRVSQSVISSGRLKFPKRLHAFTDQGVALPSSVLRCERAVQVNIAIRRPFVESRAALESNRELARKFLELEKPVGKDAQEIGAIIEAIRQLIAAGDKPRREIGFYVRQSAPRHRTRRRR